MQVPHECVHVARECMKTEAESAYNLSHANIVNALSHDMKKHSPSSDVQKHTKLTLYMIQVQLLPYERELTTVPKSSRGFRTTLCTSDP